MDPTLAPKDVELDEEENIVLKKIKLVEGEEEHQTDLDIPDQIYLNSYVQHVLRVSPYGQ